MNRKDKKMPQMSLVDRIFKKEIPRYFLLIATLLIAVGFDIIQPKFFTLNNIMNILCTTSIIGIMSIGATIVLASSEINFAIGAEATVAAAVLGVIMATNTVPYAIAFVISVVAALLIGVCSSVLSFRFGVSSFIASLAISTVMNGTIQLLTNGGYVSSPNWGSSFTFLGQGYLGVIPISVLVFALISVLAWIFVDKTTVGLRIFAVGANPVSCKQCGIKVKRIKVIAFLCSSGLAGIGGILYASQTKAVSPTLGSDMMMNAMSAAMLGAVFLRPGKYNIQGTVVASLLMTILTNGFLSIGLPTYFENIFQGAVLIVAVGFIALTRNGGLPNITFGGEGDSL